MNFKLHNGASAWASAREALGAEALSDVLDALIEWRLRDPRYYPRYYGGQAKLRSMDMQRQWTIEARADFADQAKNDMITTAIQEAAVHVHAIVALLSDGQKPQVVAFSDDFFQGHEEIALHEDKLGKAIAEHGEVGANVTADGNAGVSSEMMQALSDMNSDAKK